MTGSATIAQMRAPTPSPLMSPAPALRRSAGDRLAPAGGHQQADLVLVRRPAVDDRRRSGRGT